jgi:hypothetical protein
MCAAMAADPFQIQMLRIMAGAANRIRTCDTVITIAAITVFLLAIAAMIASFNGARWRPGALARTGPTGRRCLISSR